MLYRIEVDATKLSGPSIAVPNVVGALDANVIQPLQLEPGSHSVQTHTASDTSWQFEVTPQGLVDYAPILDASHGGFLTGRGSTTLGIVGFTITMDATLLTATTFLVYGITGEMPTSEVQQRQLLPGKYNFRNVASFGPLIPFEIKADGTVAYDPSFDADASPTGFFKGMGTSKIVLLGHTVYADAQALDAPTLLVYGITYDWLTAQVKKLTLLPGPYNFRNPSGIRPLIPFAIKADGTVDYDGRYDADASPKGFFKGRGTSTIVLLGHTITLDARALSAPTLLIYGITEWDTTKVKHVKLLPAQYNFRNPAGIRPLIPFEVKIDGTVDYDPSYDYHEVANPKGFFTGLGTREIVLLGHTITIDARALTPTVSKFSVNGITTDELPTAEVQPLQLLPAYYVFSPAAGSVTTYAFEVTTDGNVNYGRERDITAIPPGALAGRLTDALRVVGFSILIDARAYAGAEVVLQPFGLSVDTTGLQKISLLPLPNLRLQLKSADPKTAYFDLPESGRIILDDPYPFVDIRWEESQQIVRLTPAEVRQKGQCCLALTA